VPTEVTLPDEVATAPVVRPDLLAAVYHLLGDHLLGDHVPARAAVEAR